MSDIKEELAKQIYQVASEEVAQFIDEYEVAARNPRLWEELPDVSKSYWYVRAESLISYLKSQNVVRKVDRELPTNPYQHSWMPVERDAYGRALQDMAGYVEVEDLE